MAWIIFILAALMFWSGITGESKGALGAIILLFWCALSAAIMFGAMYLRSIGW